MPGFVYDGTTWREMVPDGLQVSTPDGWKVCDNGYVYDGSAWREFFVRKIDAPPAFRATNLGAQIDSVNLAWDAVPRATSYQLAYKVNDQGDMQHFMETANLSHNATGMGADVAHAFYVRALGPGLVSPWSGPLRIRAGHTQTSIPGGSHTVAAPVRSHSRWRQGTWGYGGSSQPYWGWYNTEAYRYQGALEIDPGLLQHYIYAYHGHIANVAGWGAFTCNAASINLSRLSGVGASGSAVTAQVSLAWGLNYGGGEMPAQGNIHDIALQPAGARHDYAIPANWFTAIFQQHGPYNGLVFRAYRNDGGRQAYAALNADAYWSMNYSWPTIITRHQANTAWW